jgi:site-specific recombinase XerC
LLDIFRKIKTLGESDSDDDNALGWVKKSRKLEKEKALADKRVSFLYLACRIPSGFCQPQLAQASLQNTVEDSVHPSEVQKFFATHSLSYVSWGKVRSFME